MLRSALSLLLIWALCAPSLVAASTTPAQVHPQGFQKMSPQQKVLEIPAGALVKVRLKNKENFRGRMGAVTSDGFVVQIARGERIEERTVAFDALKSIKEVESGMSTGAKVGLGILAGVGITFGVLIAVALAAGD